MRALVYHGPGQKAWEEVADPEILDDGDVIVRVDATTICGTDLHILKGDVPTVHNGRILGHEAVGTVWEAGDGVRRFSPGDRVLVSCISACGSCQFCRDGRYGQCLEGGGWVLGHKVDGTQAEFVRVLYADPSGPAAGTTCWPRSRWTERGDDHERHGQGRNDHRGGGGQAGDHLQGDGGGAAPVSGERAARRRRRGTSARCRLRGRPAGQGGA